jgi:hypothetical protein
MTDEPWPPRPADRIRHDWRCIRRAPIVETIRADPSGRPHVVALRTECDATDIDARIRDEAQRRPT